MESNSLAEKTLEDVLREVYWKGWYQGLADRSPANLKKTLSFFSEEIEKLVVDKLDKT